MATHSSVLAWRIPGTGKPGGLPSMGSHRVGHDWSDLAAATLRKFINCFINFLLCVKFEHAIHNHHYAAAAKSLQSCPTLCDPRDGSPPGFPVPGILQASTLEWVAISFSRGSSQFRNWTHVSCLASGFFTTEPPGKTWMLLLPILSVLEEVYKRV